jgi:hypothetical protein
MRPSMRWSASTNITDSRETVRPEPRQLDRGTSRTLLTLAAPLVEPGHPEASEQTIDTALA